MKFKLILLFIFLFQAAFSQTIAEREEHAKVNKKLMEAMSIPHPMVEDNLRHVFMKFQKSISHGFMQQGLSESVAMNSAIDSTFSVIELYTSLSGLYRKSKVAQRSTGDAYMENRKEFVDSLCRVYGMQRYCPTLDSIYAINIKRLENLRKDLSKE